MYFFRPCCAGVRAIKQDCSYFGWADVPLSVVCKLVRGTEKTAVILSTMKRRLCWCARSSQVYSEYLQHLMMTYPNTSVQLTRSLVRLMWMNCQSWQLVHLALTSEWETGNMYLCHYLRLICPWRQGLRHLVTSLSHRRLLSPALCHLQHLLQLLRYRSGVAGVATNNI